MKQQASVKAPKLPRDPPFDIYMTPRPAVSSCLVSTRIVRQHLTIVPLPLISNGFELNWTARQVNRRESHTEADQKVPGSVLCNSLLQKLAD